MQPSEAIPSNPITRVPKRRWRIAWLLGLGVLVNYFDRVNLSVSQAALFTSFGISAVTFGYLSGAYNWTYALCQLPIGVILDRFGVRRVGRISIFLWGIASFAAALSTSVAGLFGARLLLGIGEAPTFPANAKAIGRWFPPQERGFATSFFDGGAKFASAIGVPLLGLLLLRIGWRWSFAATGAISLLYLVLFSRIYCDPQDDAELTVEERTHIELGLSRADVRSFESASPVPFATLLRQRKVLAMVLGFGSYNYVFYLLLTWLPSYLSIQLHMDLMHSFLYTSFPWLVATFGDLAIGGWLSDNLIQRGWNASRVRRSILIIGTICGLGILGAAHPHGPVSALLWISLSIGGLSAAAPVGWTVPSLIAPRDSVASVGGIMNFSNQISGIAAPIVTGYIVQSFHSFAWAFAVAGIYLGIGVSSYIFLLGEIEPMFPERA